MRPRRNAALPSATINITSLLDITFVLLIAFMVVAPALKYSVDLELPNVTESQSRHTDKALTVFVTHGISGTQYIIDGQVYKLDVLPDMILSHPTYRESPFLAIEGDKDTPWDDMAKLLNELKLNDINTMGFVLEGRS